MFVLMLVTLLAISMVCAFYGTTLLAWTIAMSAGIVLFGVTGAVPVVGWVLVGILFATVAIPLNIPAWRRQLISSAFLAQSRRMLPEIRVDPRVEEYILDLVRATREAGTLDAELGSWIEVGASPRATIFLGRAARAQAFIAGRPFVMPEDVRDLAMDVLRHRLVMTFEAEAEEVSPDEVIERLLGLVPIP